MCDKNYLMKTDMRTYMENTFDTYKNWEVNNFAMKVDGGIKKQL